ncbi:hypothetical protein [uncultured Maribacter sp.]|uniref:hypothetical protein n=1 Tax=uncultured Maribacter sp. TaxID=431308 RepID=UPI0030EB49BA|tara:strand:- start:177680 stop:177832 length:153 start_codon:yes stop_codon:yes gene_type:complete
MKFIKRIAIVLLIVLVGIQFVPTKGNQSDAIPITDFITVNNVPKTVNNNY